MCYSEYIEKGYICFPEQFHTNLVQKRTSMIKEKFPKIQSRGVSGNSDDEQIEASNGKRAKAVI